MAVQPSSQERMLPQVAARLGQTLCDHKATELRRLSNPETSDRFKVVHVDQMAPWNGNHNSDNVLDEDAQLKEGVVLRLGSSRNH